MTVAHQYSTLKNEKLYTISYTVQTISTQSYTQAIHEVIKAEPKNSTPPQTPSRGAGRPKFNQLEIVTAFTYKPSLVMIYAPISTYRCNRPTNKQTATIPQTDRTDYNIYSSLFVK